MFATGILPALVLLVVMARLPESPRWLTRRGEQHVEIRSVVKRVPGDGSAQIWASDVASPDDENWGELLRPGVRKALAVGVLLAILSVCVGINAVILYGPVILMQGAGDDAAQALLGGVALGGVNFLFSLIAMVTIDRLGRKPLLVCGLAGMSAAMLMLGLRFGNNSGQPSAGLLAPILAFVAFYALSLGPVTWVIISEIFPTGARGAGMALCMVVMYLADFAVTRLFPWMMQHLGSGGFQVFTAICAAGMILVLAWVPETKGKSLEQIQASWSRP
jgi:SP family arabinose:H+ symporter-like MFS transporter